MATTEEIMIALNAQDNASSVLGQVNQGLNNISQAYNGMISSMTGGKSAGDLIFGTSSKAETNNALLSMMTETEDAAKSLYDTVDNVTNTSLTSMQNLIPALNAFKSATGATDEQIENATEGIAAFGAKVLAQTGSTDLAEQAMMDLSKGIKGACASLDQYGITVDALKRTGKWSGDETDIEGYIAAVQELTGDTSALLETNEGLDALIGKQWSKAGKKIGNEFLPVIKEVKKAFLSLDTNMGGNLTASLLLLGQGLETSSSMVFQINTLADGIRNLGSAAKGVPALLSKIPGLGGKASKIPDSGIDKELSKVRKSAEKTTKEAGKLAKLQPSMIASQAGVSSFSSAFSGFGAAVGSLVAPAYMVAAAIALVMPAVALLAAEALLLMKGIQILIKALNFEGIDLSGAVDSMKELAIAMGLIAVVMGEMTLVGLETALLNTATLGTIVPLIGVAVTQIKQVAEKLSELNNIPSVSDDGAKKLETFKTSMESLSSALGSIASVAWDTMMGNLMTLGGTFGNFQSIMRDAMNDLKNAVKALNEFNGEQYNIPEGIGKKLTDLADALKPIKEGINSMKSINNAEFSWNPLTNLTKALESAKIDLKNAAKALNDFNGVNYDIPEGIGKKLTTLADALKPISIGLDSLRKIQKSYKDNATNDSTVGGKGVGVSIAEALENVKEDFKKAAEALKDFDGGAYEIPPNIGDKLATLANALKPITIALDNLNKIKDSYKPSNSGTNVGVSIQTAIDSMKKDLQKTITALKELNTEDLESIQGVGAKITDMANALKPISTALDNLNKIKDAYKTSGKVDGGSGDGGSSIQTAIESMKTDLQATISALKELNEGDLGSIQGVGTKIQELATSMGSVKTAIDQLSALKSSYAGGKTNQSGSGGGTSLAGIIEDAKEDILKTAEALNGLTGISVPEGIATKVTRVADAMKPLKNAVTVINQNPIPAVMGGTENIDQAVEKVKKIALSINSLSGTTVTGTGALNAISNAINQIKSILNTGIGGVSASATNVGRAIGNGIKSGMSGLGGSLQSITSSAMGQVRSAAGSGATQAGTTASNNFKSNFKIKSAVDTEMQGALQSVKSQGDAIVQEIGSIASRATTTFTVNLEQHSPGKIARSMGMEMDWTRESVVSRKHAIVKTVSDLARSIVDAFGIPKLSVSDNFNDLNKVNGQFIQTLGLVNGSAVPNVGDNKGNAPIINIHEGAIQLDARNLTTHECKQVMINALEGLDGITNIDIRGV